MKLQIVFDSRVRLVGALATLVIVNVAVLFGSINPIIGVPASILTGYTCGVAAASSFDTVNDGPSYGNIITENEQTSGDSTDVENYACYGCSDDIEGDIWAQFEVTRDGETKTVYTCEKCTRSSAAILDHASQIDNIFERTRDHESATGD